MPGDWRSGRVEVAGGYLAYHRTGTAGPPLVLSHGLTDNGLCWRRTAAVLAERFDVIMLDARGHGQSASISPGVLTDPALDIAQAIEQLSLDAPIVMGHSVGARSTARYASAFPDKVSRVILEDPPLAPPPDAAKMERWREGFRQQVQAFQTMTTAQIVAMGRKASPNWHEDEFPDWAIAKQQVDPDAVLFETEPWQTYLARITAPTLLIYGQPELGGLVTPQLAKEAKALNRQIRAVQIKAAGHNTRRENFSDYLAAVQAFLSEA